MDCGMLTAIPFTDHKTNIVLQCLLHCIVHRTMNRYSDSVSPWGTPKVVLNHSVGPSSIETQAEVSLYIWIISLIRQFDTLHWLRIIGIDDLWRVSNAF